MLWLARQVSKQVAVSTPKGVMIVEVPRLAMHVRRGSRVLPFLPLLGRVAFWGPSMDGGNLGLQEGVDQSMPCYRGLFVKLRRNDDGLKHLTAAT